jgi:hypothetical protein
VITKEWLEYEIGRLERELAGAGARYADAEIKFVRARAEYDAARESAETLEGCLRGIRDELALMTDGKSAT